MLRSADVGCGAYGSGRPHIARWTLVDGYPRCLEGPLSVATDPPAELVAAVARNLALSAVLARVEACEATSALLAEADEDLRLLVRTRADTLLPDEDGYMWGLPPVPDVPDPCTHVAEWDGEAWAVRPLAPDELAGWPLQRAAFVPKMAFARLLQDVLGEVAAAQVLAGFATVLALATDVDHADVFAAVDGGPSYAAQLVAAGAVTPAQVAALAAAWPLAA